MEHEENQSNSIRHPAVDEFAPEMMTRILGNILSYTIVQRKYLIIDMLQRTSLATLNGSFN